MTQPAFPPWRSVAAVIAMVGLFALSACEGGGPDAEIIKKLDAAGKSKGRVFPDKEDYYGVFVLDDNNAWAVGNRGAILHFANKGEKVTFVPTWVEQAFYNVNFTDPQNGIAVGQDGLIVVTSDGGKKWEQVKVELLSDDRAIVYVPDKYIPAIIGREGKNIQALEEQLGIGLDIRELGEQPKAPSGKEIPFRVSGSGKHVEFLLGEGYSGKDVNIYLNDEYLATFNVSKQGVVRIKKSNKFGNVLIDALDHNEKVSFRVG